MIFFFFFNNFFFLFLVKFQSKRNRQSIVTNHDTTSWNLVQTQTSQTLLITKLEFLEHRKFCILAHIHTHFLHTVPCTHIQAKIWHKLELSIMISTFFCVFATFFIFCSFLCTFTYIYSKKHICMHNLWMHGNLCRHKL